MKDDTLESLEKKLLGKLVDKNLDIETFLKITDRIVDIVKVRQKLKDETFGKGFDTQGG